jgi:hypothetical protein
MAKKVDPAKEKAKRQKLIAIVGGVILLGLLAFQLPKTMKMLKNPGNVTTSASTTPASTTTPGATPLAPPTLDGGAATSAAAGNTPAGAVVDTSDDGVRDPSTPLPADAGQLVSFNRFKSKDPFAQQVTNCGTESCDTGSSTSAGAAPSPAPAGSGSGTGTGLTGGGTGSSAGGAKPKPATVKPAPAAPVSTALISVNGKPESVAVGKPFPSTDPVFMLLRATRTFAMISVSGGSLESGAPAVRLSKGKTVTLQNTADGTQYVLKLLRTA